MHHVVLTVLAQESPLAGLEHADHRVVLASQRHSPADGRLWAEEHAGQSRAENGHSRGLAVFQRRKRAATRELGANDVEKRGRGALDEHRV